MPEFAFNSSAIKRRNKNKNTNQRILKSQGLFQKSDLTCDRQNKAGINIPAIPKTATAISISTIRYKSQDGLTIVNTETVSNHYVMISRDYDLRKSLSDAHVSLSKPRICHLSIEYA